MKSIRQPYLAPHAWSLAQIVSFRAAILSRHVRLGKKTLDEARGEARPRFASHPDLASLTIREIERRVEA